MKKSRYTFQFALFILIILVFIGLGILIGQLFKNYFIDTFHSQFQKQGELIVQQIRNQGGVSTNDKQKIDKLQQLIEAQITIVNQNGEIIYDSGPIGEPYIKHSEALQEIKNSTEKKDRGIKHFGAGFDITYYWEIIEKDGELDGILILTTPVNELHTAYQQIWLLLFIILGIAFIVILFISSKIISSFTKPVESAIKTAIELAKGNYHARTYEDYNSQFSLLNTSINILARNLQRITKEQEMQKDRLMTVIENMGIPLLLIDDKGYITLTNHTYNEVFRVNDKQIVENTYLETIEHDQVKQIIEEVFMTEQKIRRQIIIPINIHLKHFEVYGAPIISYHNEWKGIVIVFHDITEIKKLEKIRKDFVANVSHELRTPITSIKGFTETLLDGALHDQKALESFLNIILKESNRLQTLTNDLLELSRIEQDAFRLTIANVNMNALINEIVVSLAKKAENKGIELLISGAENTIVEADQSRIQQIFVNLISNAISYTPPSGKVKIVIDETTEYVGISIEDTGIGLSKNEIPRIFERFYRVDKARSRNSGGTGLGLAIVKHLVEAHRGEILVDSEIRERFEIHC